MLRLKDTYPHRLQGQLRLDVFQRGRLIERSTNKNLIVNGALTALANLAGGVVANQSVTQIGFGTSATAPAVGNTSLTSAFIKALDSVSFPAAGQVQFNFSLLTTEENGVAISEFGLFTAGNVLFSRLVRASPLNKASDISISGSWLITM